MVKSKNKILESDECSDDDFEIENGKNKERNKRFRAKRTTRNLNSGKKKTKIIEEQSSEEDELGSDKSEDHSGNQKPVRKKRKSKIESSDESNSSTSFNSDESGLEINQGKEFDEETSDGDSHEKGKKHKRKHARRKKNVESTPGGRKKIRSILADTQLREETKDAEKQEEERRQRLKEREDDKIIDVDVEEGLGAAPVKVTKRLVLQKQPLVEVNHEITIHLKPHQVEGIQFIWDNLIETTSQAKDKDGGGCILAHCMGLGKTLQTITVIHTILNCKHLGLRTALIVAPLNTLLNWIAEFLRWVPDDQPVEIYNLTEYASRQSRRNALEEWRKSGGVMVIGYDMFRLLATGKGIRHKATKSCYAAALLDPGPDIIVCDEGHKLKNCDANISVTMNKVRTCRRLVLTGTPLQNNLIEYQCMVNFVKKNLLGTIKEFRNRFVNPIINGQHSDSTKHDVRIMKNRCHVLHEMLNGFVQRKDYTALAQYLCDKHEFIMKIRLSPLQVKLYQHYLDTCTKRGSNPSASSSKDGGLFADYQNLMRVWTHPRILRLHSRRKEIENMRNFVDDSEEEASMTDDEVSSLDDENNKESDNLGLNHGESGGNLKDSSDDEHLSIVKRKSRRLKGSDEESLPSSGAESEEESEEDEVKVESRVWRKCRRYKLRGQKETPVKKTRSRLIGSDSSGSDIDCSLAEANGEKEESKYDDSNTWYDGLLNQQTDAYKRFDVSGKIMVLFEILRLARECNDKVLVFSQSLLSLDLIEEMLALSTSIAVAMETDDLEVPDGGGDLPQGFHQMWYKNVDYFRMDGSSLGKSRQRWINEFNDVSDERSRLFLISTRAGSLGVNLVAANRVVIFDVSWNPSHDIQSIFRVYRFGQTKTCFIYRLISEGTMEEKIYDRQVTKQSLAFRVVDEQQINRHFTAHDLYELYKFSPTPLPETLPVHALPKDKLLAEVLVGKATRDLIVSYHKHDSLLDHQETEELTEEERKSAWEEYENEKKGIRVSNNTTPQPNLLAQMMGQSLKGVSPFNFIQTQNLQLLTVGGFQRQQVLRKLLILKQQRMETGGITVDDVTNVLLPCVDVLSPDKQKTAKSCLSFMIKASTAMEDCRKKMDSNKLVDIRQMVQALKPLPMYQHMSEECIRMLSIEVQVRQQQARLAAEKEYKGNLAQMRWFEEKFMKLFLDVPNSSTNQNSTANNKPEEISLFNASTFARNVFAQMVSSQGGARNLIGESSKVPNKNTQSVSKMNTDVTSSVPMTQSLPAHKTHATSSGMFKFGIPESQPTKIKSSPMDGAKLARDCSTHGDVKESDELPVVTVERLQVDSKRLLNTRTKENKGNVPQMNKASTSNNKKRKTSILVVSSDSQSSDDDDWETRYVMNSKSRRRTAL